MSAASRIGFWSRTTAPGSPGRGDRHGLRTVPALQGLPLLPGDLVEVEEGGRAEQPVLGNRRPAPVLRHVPEAGCFLISSSGVPLMASLDQFRPEADGEKRDVRIRNGLHLLHEGLGSRSESLERLRFGVLRIEVVDKGQRDVGRTVEHSGPDAVAPSRTRRCASPYPRPSRSRSCGSSRPAVPTASQSSLRRSPSSSAPRSRRPGWIGPRHHDDLSDPARGDAGIRQTPGRGRVARGDVWIGAVMEAQIRSLRSLEHDPVARGVGLLQFALRAADEVLEFRDLSRQSGRCAELRPAAPPQDLARSRHADALLSRADDLEALLSISRSRGSMIIACGSMARRSGVSLQSAISFNNCCSHKVAPAPIRIAAVALLCVPDGSCTYL